MQNSAVIAVLACAVAAHASSYTTYIGDTNPYQVSAIATDFSEGPVTQTATGSGVYTGLLLGVGLEYAFDAHWSVKGEYDYINYGSKNVAMTGNFDYIAAIKNYENIVKVGANYRF